MSSDRRDRLNQAVQTLLSHREQKQGVPPCPGKVRREGDEMVCSCGVRWDVTDKDKPKGH